MYIVEKEWVKINEGRFIDGAILLVLTSRLLKPFTSWPAYKSGIIDENGNKIKDPTTSREKDDWTLLNRFLAKIKKMFIKHKLIGSLLTFYVLLKEDASIEDNSLEYLVEQRQKEDKVKDLSYRIRNEIMKEGFSEDEYYTILTNIQIKDIVNNHS